MWGEEPVPSPNSNPSKTDILDCRDRRKQWAIATTCQESQHKLAICRPAGQQATTSGPPARLLPMTEAMDVTRRPAWWGDRLKQWQRRPQTVRDHADTKKPFKSDDSFAFGEHRHPKDLANTDVQRRRQLRISQTRKDKRDDSFGLASSGVEATARRESKI